MRILPINYASIRCCQLVSLLTITLFSFTLYAADNCTTEKVQLQIAEDFLTILKDKKAVLVSDEQYEVAYELYSQYKSRFQECDKSKVTDS